MFFTFLAMRCSQTPLLATLTFTAIATLIAVVIELDAIVDFLSIGSSCSSRLSFACCDRYDNGIHTRCTRSHSSAISADAADRRRVQDGQGFVHVPNEVYRRFDRWPNQGGNSYRFKRLRQREARQSDQCVHFLHHFLAVCHG